MSLALDLWTAFVYSVADVLTGGRRVHRCDPDCGLWVCARCRDTATPIRVETSASGVAADVVRSYRRDRDLAGRR